MTSYTVVGPGAVGLLYGGRLQQAGHDVTWVSSTSTEVLRRDGIEISANGVVTRLSVAVVDDPSEAPVSDVVLVSLKTTANGRLTELVGPAVAEGATVALFQNGLGGEGLVRRMIPAAGSVVGALCFVCAHRREPGVVEHLDYGAVDLAEYEADAVTPGVRMLAADLRSAGFDASGHADLNTARWGKLVWNIPYNGLSVVLDADTDELMADPAAEALVVRAMSEVVRAGRACGADLGDSFAEQRRDMTRSMTPYAPSMKLDFDEGRAMEISAIYDAPIAAAGDAGVPMPTVEVIRDQLLFLDRRRSTEH